MNTIMDWLFGSNAGEFAGGGDWRIDFIGEYNAYVKFALLLVGVAMVYLTIRSYLREGDTKKKIKFSLAAIRITVIVLALMILLRPAVVLRYTRTLYSNVLVLVDDSMSMSFKDRYSQEKDAKGLSASLGVDAGKLPDYSRLDVFRQMAARDKIFEKLAKDHPLEFMRFSTSQPGTEAYTKRLGPVIEDAILDPKKTSKQPSSAPAKIDAMMASVHGEGYETNIPAALRDAIDALQGKRAYIVMVSDFRMTSESAANRLAGAREYAAQRGYPIYTICVGDKTPPKNLAVLGLQIPRDVRMKSSIQVATKVAHRGLAGQTVALKLQRRESNSKDWEDVKTEQVRFADAEGDPTQSRGEQTVEMTIEPDKVGEFVYRAILEPRADEQTPDDNAAESIVKVTDAQIKVLLVSGDAGFEFQYLKNYLLSQPELYKISVWQENADPEVNQAASNGMKLTEFPNSLDAIMGSKDGKFPGYDAVILYDPQPTDKGFDKNFVDNLKTAVEKHNVGLCFIAGNKYTDRVLGMKGEKDDFKSLRDLVPVSVTVNSDMPELMSLSDKKAESYPLHLTEYGLDHAVMRMGPTSEETIKLWDKMPGIFWSHALSRVKPAARILAENSNEMRRMDRTQAEPLIVTQPVGNGRVVYVNFDETWRWRQIADQKYYRSFWSNMVKYLTPIMARQVTITTGGDRFSAGDNINVDVEAYDDDYQALKEPTYTLTLIDKTTGEKSEIKLDAVMDKPGRYKGTIAKGLTAHRGVFELNNPAVPPGKLEPKVFRVELPQAEAERPEADGATSESVASKPEFALNVTDLDKLSTLIPSGKLPAVRDVPRELWDTRLSLILIVLLLTIEWVLRKKYNMA